MNYKVLVLDDGETQSYHADPIEAKAFLDERLRRNFARTPVADTVLRDKYRTLIDTLATSEITMDGYYFCSVGGIRYSISPERKTREELVALGQSPARFQGV